MTSGGKTVGNELTALDRSIGELSVPLHSGEGVTKEDILAAAGDADYRILGGGEAGGWLIGMDVDSDNTPDATFYVEYEGKMPVAIGQDAGLWRESSGWTITTPWGEKYALRDMIEDYRIGIGSIGIAERPIAIDVLIVGLNILSKGALTSVQKDQLFPMRSVP